VRDGEKQPRAHQRSRDDPERERPVPADALAPVSAAEDADHVDRDVRQHGDEHGSLDVDEERDERRGNQRKAEADHSVRKTREHDDRDQRGYHRQGKKLIEAEAHRIHAARCGRPSCSIRCSKREIRSKGASPQS